MAQPRGPALHPRASWRRRRAITLALLGAALLGGAWMLDTAYLQAHRSVRVSTFAQVRSVRPGPMLTGRYDQRVRMFADVSYSVAQRRLTGSVPLPDCATCRPPAPGSTIRIWYDPREPDAVAGSPPVDDPLLRAPGIVLAGVGIVLVGWGAVRLLPS